MALSKETEEWLQGLEKEGGMSPAAVLELKQHFSSDKANEFVKGSVLRQNDYSRNMAEVQKRLKEADDAQEGLRARDEAVRRYQGELGTWKAQSEESYKTALEEREKAERKANAALSRVKKIAAEHGLDENELLKDLDMSTPVTSPVVAATFDTSGFVTKKDLEKGAVDSAFLESIVNDIADEHRELFGTNLKRTDLVREALQSGKSVEAFWKEKYKVGEKLAALQEAKIDQRIKDAVATREAELRSIIPNSPQPRAGDEDNPLLKHRIFTNKTLVDQNKKEQLGDGSDGVSAALSAFNSGKYRQDWRKS